MAKYVMVVASSAQPGRDDDYNEWYDTEHMQEICALPGIISGKRYTAAASPNAVPGQYLSIFELETDDVTAFMAEMGRRSVAGEMSRTDALDIASAKLWFYEAR